MQKSKQTLPKSTPVIPPPTTNTTTTAANLISNVNPWTNKVKIRGEGLLNSIMNKYMNDEEDYRERAEESQLKDVVGEEYEREYLKLAEKIKIQYEVRNKIEENMKPLFQLQARCAKIDQLLQWLQKIQNRTISKESPLPQQPNKNPNLKPIDTSFIYLPLHSQTIFHEILADCVNRDKTKGVGQYRNMKLKAKIQEINEVYGQNLCDRLDSNIL